MKRLCLRHAMMLAGGAALFVGAAPALAHDDAMRAGGATPAFGHQGSPAALLSFARYGHGSWYGRGGWDGDGYGHEGRGHGYGHGYGHGRGHGHGYGHGHDHDHGGGDDHGGHPCSPG
ncbi:MAG: hypothetical protein ACTHMG_03790 [Sphingomonas sp.]